MHVQIFIRHHGAALIPLPPANHINLPYTKRIGAPDNRPHVKIPLGVLQSNHQAMICSVQFFHNLCLAPAFEFIDYIPRVFHVCYFSKY